MLKSSHARTAGLHTTGSASLGFLASAFAPRVSQTELTAFTRQLSTLLKAGVPIVRALDTLLDMTRPGLMHTTLEHIRNDINTGDSLSDAMSHHPRVFDEMFVSMVRAGEAGGFLSSILRRLSDFLAQANKLRGRIRGALAYPLAVMGTASAILAALMVFVIPKIIEVFNEQGITLPLSTRILVSVSEMTVAYWYVLIFLPIAFMMTWRVARNLRAGQYATDMLLLYLPVFGPILRKSTVSRVCRTFAELDAAGVPVLDSLDILRSAAGNRVVGDALVDVQESVRSGESLSAPMRKSGVFDAMVVNMVEVGEESGTLESMMRTIADDYEEQVDQMVASLMSLLEPALVIAMGVIIGGIVLALFQPFIEFITSML